MAENEIERAGDDGFDYSSWLHARVREIHRDRKLWVLDKPAGILSHPNPRPGPARAAAGPAANALLRAPYDRQRELYRLRVRGEGERQVWLVHRLDLETSGLILCTLDAESAAHLKEALYRREVEKEYRALVVGLPVRDEGEWSDCLERVSRGGRVEVRVAPGKRHNATARYRVVRTLPRVGLSLLSLSPRTGRTHQLRVQAASRRLPIAGDDRYGDFTANRFLAERTGLGRMFLHASRLELRHPASGHRLKFSCGLSAPLESALERASALAERAPRRRQRPRKASSD